MRPEGEESALMIRMKRIETAQKLLARDSEANSKEESESLRQKVLLFLQAVVVQNQQHQNQLDAINLYNRHLECQMETVDDNSITADKEADNILDKVPLHEKSREPSVLVNGNYL
ncbi:hypothetical protein T08_3307 [Trichinella sp. T8]|nr:hypothetical protein T08_3307 [Trichinella sp. T8]